MSDDLLARWQPSAHDAWDLRKVGHLVRRTGFGASLGERLRFVQLGLQRTLAQLAGDVEAAGEADPLLESVLALGGLERVRGWRFHRMATARAPLRQRMSLFWHGHFATSNQKVQSERMMARQAELFDRLGLGRFDDLLLEVARDPAMVRWLDNDTNRKGQPNENFARELFELFALGRGHYSEQDIREAARAFTGWHLRGEQFRFFQALHDDGSKQVFGKQGSFGGEEVVAMTVRRPESARFLAARWLAWFVHPEPTAQEIAAFAAVYEREQRHVGRTLRVLLQSRLFFSPRAYRSLVKSPVDLTVGLVRSLGAQAAPRELARAAARMGQSLLEPPSVEGWHEHRGWITSASWLQRSNFAADLFAGRRAFALRPTPQALLAAATTPQERAELALRLLLDGEVSASGREAVLSFAATPAAREPQGAGALLHTVMTLPEAHLL